MRLLRSAAVLRRLSSGGARCQRARCVTQGSLEQLRSVRKPKSRPIHERGLAAAGIADSIAN